MTSALAREKDNCDHICLLKAIHASKNQVPVKLLVNEDT